MVVLDTFCLKENAHNIPDNRQSISVIFYFYSISPLQFIGASLIRISEKICHGGPDRLCPVPSEGRQRRGGRGDGPLPEECWGP